jgi:hypothetical protein
MKIELPIDATGGVSFARASKNAWSSALGA